MISTLRNFIAKTATLFRRERAERELTREIDSHLQLLEDQFVTRGLSAEDARVAARRAFGGVDQAREGHRDARSFRWIDDSRRDIVYAARSLARTPGFSMATVLTLAVGIGATTAIYSVVDAILLRPLPFPNANQLVRIAENDVPMGMQPPTFQDYLEWRSRTRTLSGLAASSYNPQVTMAMREGTVRVAVARVSTNYFEILGATALVGRTIQSSDDANPDVVVLTHDTWQRYFHGDPEIVGRVIEFRSSDLAGRLFTIIGVTPEGLQELATGLDLYTPFSKNARFGLPPFIGRLREGVSLAEASQEANAIGSAIRPARPAAAPALTRPRFEARDLKEELVGTLRPALRVFLAAVAVVLLIVCANVANLLLARGTARQREIAVRLAIGASRGRIARQILTECAVLAATGGAIGAVIGAGGVALVKALATTDAPGIFRLALGSTILPRAHEVGVNPRVFGIAFGIAALTCIVCGWLPALHLSRTTQLQTMGARSAGRTRRDTRARTALVLGQLVMATVLLVAAGLLAHSFIKLATVEKGYDPRHVLAFQLVMPAEYATTRKAETIETLLQWLRAKPDIESAGFAYSGILLGIQDTVGFFVPPGRSLDDMRMDLDKPRLKSLSRGYLEAAGVTLVAGRLIEERDGPPSMPAVVLNRKAASRYFGEGNPVGSFLEWRTGTDSPTTVQVIGVIDDIRQNSPEREAYGEIFMDYRQVLALHQAWGFATGRVEQISFGFLSFALRTKRDPVDAIPIVREAVSALDRNLGIDAIVPLERLVASSVARQRFYAVLLSVFAGVAGLLAAIGIYGVLAYAVVQRTQEIGVRMALGAERRQVLALVLRRGLLLTFIGVAIGLVGAAAGARSLQSMLFGIQPLDAETFASVGGAFAIVALLASYLPARRATKVDPIVALRVD